MHVYLASPIDVADFRGHANSLLAHQVPPAEIDWHTMVPTDGCTMLSPGVSVRSAPSALHSIVPRSFVRLTELVMLHRDSGRFELLYRLLWRLVHEPELASAHGDDDMALAQSMAQAVRRDILKMRNGLQLRELAPLAGETFSFAWCEPQHRVTEVVAEGLSLTRPAAPWLLASPDRCVLWSGGHLLCGPGLDPVQGRAMNDAQWHDLAVEMASLPLATA